MPALRSKTFPIAAAAVLLCGLAALPARPEPRRAPKRDTIATIQALEAEWRRAQMAADLPALDKLLSDDFVGITASGDMNTKAQQLARLRDHAFVITKLDTSDVKVKLLGNIAIVTSLAEVVGTNDGAPIDGTFRYTRVYHRVPGSTWKITSFEATRVPKNRVPKPQE
jgi:ketosteroid isomerase-like protein